MMDANLKRIEAILTEIERLEMETGGAFFEPLDAKEAREIITRIEQKMLEKAA